GGDLDDARALVLRLVVDRDVAQPRVLAEAGAELEVAARRRDDAPVAARAARFRRGPVAPGLVGAGGVAGARLGRERAGGARAGGGPDAAVLVGVQRGEVAVGKCVHLLDAAVGVDAVDRALPLAIAGGRAGGRRGRRRRRREDDLRAVRLRRGRGGGLVRVLE